MAGRKVGGRATEPSQKEIEELIKRFNSSRSIIETHLGRYQSQRDDICYANNVAPSRADMPSWNNRPISHSHGNNREIVIPDISGAVNSFEVTPTFEKMKNTLKVADIFSDIKSILTESLSLADKKVQQVQTLTKTIKELEQLAFKVKKVVNIEYRGSVVRFLGYMGTIMVDIKHFYERVESTLIDFDRKTATQMAEAEAELNKLMDSGFTRIQIKIDDLFNSMKGWVGKGPKMEKLMAGFAKFRRISTVFHIPILGALVSYVEFIGAVNKFAKNPTDENREKMNIKLINFCVECIIELVLILVALWCTPLLIILVIILVIIGIRDLVTDEDTIAELIRSSWNKRMQMLNYITDTFNSAKNSIHVFADDVEKIFWETADKLVALGK